MSQVNERDLERNRQQYQADVEQKTGRLQAIETELSNIPITIKAANDVVKQAEQELREVERTAATTKRDLEREQRELTNELRKLEAQIQTMVQQFEEIKRSLR